MGRIGQLQSLQLVRAIAMLLVLFIHLDFFSTKVLDTPFLYGLFSPGGDGGVDMFFVLSGFIIYFVHNQDIGQKQKLLPYLIKRLVRIYPIYWIVTIGVLILHILFPGFGTGEETQALTIIRSLLLFPSTNAPIIHAAWTLIYEVLFYLSFGGLIWFRFNKIKPLLFIVFFLTLTGWVYSLFRNEEFQSSIFYVFFSYHNFEFLLGCLGSYLVSRRELKIANQLLIFGSILFAAFIILEYLHGSAIYQFRIIGFGFSAFLIITSLSSLEIYKRITFPQSIVYKFFLLLGNASFSIYLTHQVLISGIGRTFNGFLPAQALILTTLVSTVVIGIIFYQLIEKPLLRLFRQRLLTHST